MAPRKAPKRAPARKVAARRVQQRRPRRATFGQALNTFIVKGVNALLSAIPAAKIFAPITDFLFKSVGFTTAVSTEGDTITATTVIYGMGAAFAIPLSAIIENAPLLAKHRASKGAELYTTFSHGQLLQLRVTVRPVGELAHRQGNLALAFIPYTTSESGRFYNGNVDIPTLQDVLAVPKAVQGSGTRTLSVNYRARGNQFCCLPHPLTTEIGLVLIGYQDLSRNKGSDFDAEDFGAEVIVSGTVRLSNPIPHLGYSSVSCAISDKLAKKTMRIGDYSVTNGKCEVTEEGLKVSGSFTQSPFARRQTLNSCKEEQQGVFDVPHGSPASLASMLADAVL